MHLQLQVIFQTTEVLIALKNKIKIQELKIKYIVREPRDKERQIKVNKAYNMILEEILKRMIDLSINRHTIKSLIVISNII